MTFFQRGSASLEFVVVAVGVLVPVLALSVSTSALQNAQFAVTHIARQGVRAFALAPLTSSGAAAVRRIARLTLADFGITGVARNSVTCVPTNCRTPGAHIRLATTVTVSLPMVPALPGIDVFRRIPISATAHHRAPLMVVP